VETPFPAPNARGQQSTDDDYDDEQTAEITSASDADLSPASPNSRQTHSHDANEDEEQKLQSAL